MGKWTGGTPEVLSLAYWSDGSLILPRGYIGSLLARVKHAGLRYSIADERLTLPQIDIQMNGGLRTYQETAINTMTQYGSGILVAPCGSGKTVFGMAFIAHWRQPSLILVHTKQLMKQTAESVKHWLRIDPGLIGDGVCDIEPITVGMLQTLASRPGLADSISGKFGLALQDEVHHAPCDTATDVLQRFPSAFRYGLTATPTRRDGLSPFMEALIGPIRHEITNADLRNAGVLVTPRIEWVRTDFQCDPGDWVYLIIVDANIGLLASQARTRFFDAYRSIAPDCRLPEWLERQKRRAA
jgi:superfamily II DNA or RNA helicase